MNFTLIPIAKAQGIDAAAQPTFGPVEIDGGGTPTNGVQVLLSTDKTTVAVSQTFKVAVELKTGDNISADSYQIVIKYDPLALTVVDQDSQTAGTQVTLLDTVFTIPEPKADNNTASNTTGKLTLKASGSVPVSINRKVVEITFQAQKLGDTQVEVDTTPADGTRIRRGNTDIAYTSSSLNLDITQNGQSETCENDDDCGENQMCQTNGTCVPIQTQNPCTTDSDCTEDQLCINNFCMENNNPECSQTTDCETGEICKDQECIVPECTNNDDCEAGEVCLTGSCVESGTGPVIPRTGIADEIGVPVTAFLSIMLILFGIFLKRKPHAQN